MTKGNIHYLSRLYNEIEETKRTITMLLNLRGGFETGYSLEFLNFNIHLTPKEKRIKVRVDQDELLRFTLLSLKKQIEEKELKIENLLKEMNIKIE